MSEHKVIAWFTDNPVAANLVMLIFIAGGLISLSNMHKEEFPTIDPGIIRVQVPYLGAAPEEVEQGVCIRIEEAIEGVDGMDRFFSISNEGMCTVMIEILQNVDVTRVLNDVKAKVDAISTFPAETEKPIVSALLFQGQTISFALYGNTDETTLKVLAEQMRDEISALPGISQVGVNYVRPWEISVEVSEQTLRRYNLTMSQVASAIRRSSLDLPGGSIKTQGGEILLRSKGQAYRGQEFEDIVVVTQRDGTNITLGEIADVRDGFQEGFLKAKFDGEPAVSVTIYRVGNEDTITSATAVKSYLERKQSALPK
nr:efflux RND transporter permease subunit [Pseudomonadales bacterium]